MTGENWMRKLVGTIGASSEFPGLTVPALMDMGSWGLQEWIVGTVGRTASESMDYWERLGWLLGICHVFWITDMHAENVLTTEQGPVVVDLETVAHPPPPRIRICGQDDSTVSTRKTSVLETCLLSTAPLIRKRPKLDWAYGASEENKKIAVLAFERCYLLLRELLRTPMQKSKLLSPLFRGPLRLVLRPTSEYTNLRNLIDRDELSEEDCRKQVKSILLNSATIPEAADFEVDSIFRGNIPAFRHDMLLREVALVDRPDQVFLLPRSPMDYLEDHHRTLDDDDLKLQKSTISASL
jgi:lantibiotic modifying enzyme